MKRKYIFSAGLIGIIFMMLGQLSFSINDTLVKEIVIDSSSNMSVINVIFLRGLISTFLILMFLVLITLISLVLEYCSELCSRLARC